jgi:hypothetical protein
MGTRQTCATELLLCRSNTKTLKFPDHRLEVRATVHIKGSHAIYTITDAHLTLIFYRE